MYTIRVTTTQKPTGLKSTFDIKAPFTTWFTSDGYFVAQPFQQWLASSVQMIGDADPKNAKRDERDNLAGPSVPEAKASGVDGGNASKRNKKKS